MSYKDATGKAITVDVYEKMAKNVKEEFETGLRQNFATSLGLNLAQVQILSITTGSIKVEFMVVGTAAQLTAAETSLKTSAVDKALAEQGAALLTKLVPGSTFTGTATIVASVESTTAPPVIKPKPPVQPVLDGSTPTLSTGTSATPTVILGALMAMLSLGLLKW
jgi:hypothetical protein